MSDSEALQQTDAGGDGAIQTPNSQPLTTISVSQLTDRVRKVRQARSEVMEQDIHFGTIPGTGDKPTLLKPGAEILCSLFQLAPDPSLQVEQLDGEHREYIVRGGLRHIPSGNQVGSGYGSCSTMESKYRYRYIEDATDVAVPRGFWDSGDEMADRDFSMLRDALDSEGVPMPDGAEPGVTKEQGQWLITVEGKGENPDLADIYNTCLKMAKKRWLVDVTLTATAASEIFTQDLDDLEDLRGTDVGESQPQSSGKAPRGSRPQNASTTGQQGDTSTNAQNSLHEWQAPTNDVFELPPGKIGSLNAAAEALEHENGADLAAKIQATRDGWDWDGEAGDALKALLTFHEKRLEDEEKEEDEDKPEDEAEPMDPDKIGDGEDPQEEFEDPDESGDLPF